MTKQRYLAELRRLLVFMTEEDREEAIRRYGEMFDAAGPEGEEELSEKLGSPTKAAIGLSRGYEPGSVHVDAPVVTPKRVEIPTRPKTKKPDGSGEPWDDLPEFHLPGMDEDDADPADTETPAPAPAKPAAKPVMPPTVVARDEWPDALPDEPAEPVEHIERTMPLWLGVPLFIFVMIALGLPIAAVFLPLLVVLLAPGCALLFAVYLLAVGGLWCTAYMSDAILLFGAALVVLAAAIFVLWLGLWLDGKLLSLYVRGVRWLAGELLGRKVTDYE